LLETAKWVKNYFSNKWKRCRKDLFFGRKWKRFIFRDFDAGTKYGDAWDAFKKEYPKVPQNIFRYAWEVAKFYSSIGIPDGNLTTGMKVCLMPMRGNGSQCIVVAADEEKYTLVRADNEEFSDIMRRTTSKHIDKVQLIVQGTKLTILQEEAGMLMRQHRLYRRAGGVCEREGHCASLRGSKKRQQC